MEREREAEWDAASAGSSASQLPLHMKSKGTPSSRMSRRKGTRENVGLVYSPTPEQAESFRYYCPLCMVYFPGIYKSMCCGHYICHFCLKDIVITTLRHESHTSEGLDDVDPESIHRGGVCSSPSALFGVTISEGQKPSCPYCNEARFIVVTVSKLEKVRHYQDSPDVHNQLLVPSPAHVAPANDFDELIRKLPPLAPGYRLLSPARSIQQVFQCVEGPLHSTQPPQRRLFSAGSRVSQTTHGSDHNRSDDSIASSLPPSHPPLPPPPQPPPSKCQAVDLDCGCGVWAKRTSRRPLSDRTNTAVRRNSPPVQSSACTIS